MSGGLNCTLKNKILNIPKANWLTFIKEKIDLYESEFGEVEPEKTLDLQGLNADLDRDLRAKLRCLDSNQDKRYQKPLSYH